MKMLVFQTLFWISGILIIYTSIIYYFILKLFQQIHYEKDEDYLPSISLVICAYNEEKRIREKLENTFNLEYPLEKLQVILADDGSADKTIEIAKTFEFVEVLSLSRKHTLKMKLLKKPVMKYWFLAMQIIFIKMMP